MSDEIRHCDLKLYKEDPFEKWEEIFFFAGENDCMVVYIKDSGDPRASLISKAKAEAVAAALLMDNYEVALGSSHVEEARSYEVRFGRD